QSPGSGQVLTGQISTVFLMSLTAANLDGESVQEATPNAPPRFFRLIENWPTNLPVAVNSSRPLDRLFLGLIASHWAEIRLPSGAKVRPSGPWKCLRSWSTIEPMPLSTVVVPALATAKIVLSAVEAA